MKRIQSITVNEASPCESVPEQDAQLQIDMLTSVEGWTAPAGAGRRDAVLQTMQRAKEAGVKRIYLRLFSGGQAMYPSKVATVQSGSWGFDTWNAPADAVEIAHQLGMEIHAWYTLFEEHHGHSSAEDIRNVNLSSFFGDHPEYMQMDRDGIRYFGTVDFFYDEVCQYKLKIIDEIIPFRFDGILLDYVRHNGVPSGDYTTGIHRLGYNPEIVAAFKERTGKDAFAIDPADDEWICFKAEPHIKIIREIRKRFKKANPDVELSLMLWPLDNLRWNALDVATLTRENLVDMMTAMSIAYTFHPREAKNQVECLRSQCQSDKVRIVPGVCGYNKIYPSEFEEYIEAVEQLGLIVFE